MKEYEIYQKLVDLYAGKELPEELETELEQQAKYNRDLRAEMKTLRATVDMIQDLPKVEFTEESNQRILMRLYSAGIELDNRAPDPHHIQRQLPLQS